MKTFVRWDLFAETIAEWLFVISSHFLKMYLKLNYIIIINGDDYILFVFLMYHIVKFALTKIKCI